LCTAGERKLLDELLLARALQHNAPGVLLQLACDWLRAERIVRPPVDSLTRIARGTSNGTPNQATVDGQSRQPAVAYDWFGDPSQ
jgi:hypothetical protein